MPAWERESVSTHVYRIEYWNVTGPQVKAHWMPRAHLQIIVRTFTAAGAPGGRDQLHLWPGNFLGLEEPGCSSGRLPRPRLLRLGWARSLRRQRKRVRDSTPELSPAASQDTYCQEPGVCSKAPAWTLILWEGVCLKWPCHNWAKHSPLSCNLVSNLKILWGTVKPL